MKQNYKIIRRLEERIKAELKERFGKSVVLDGEATNYNNVHDFYCYKCRSGFSVAPRYLMTNKYGCPGCKEKKIDQAVELRRTGSTYKAIAEALEISEPTARRWVKNVIHSPDVDEFYGYDLVF